MLIIVFSVWVLCLEKEKSFFFQFLTLSIVFLCTGSLYFQFFMLFIFFFCLTSLLKNREFFSISYVNGSQLAKTKKSIPHMSLPWNL